MERHNNICDGVSELASKAFTPTHMRYDTKINTGRAMLGEEGKTQRVPFKGQVVAKGGYPDQVKTCVPLIRTTPPIFPKNLRSAWRPLIRIRIGSTLTPASNIVGTSLPFSPQWTAFLGSRRRQHLSVSPSTSRQSGRIHTNVPMGT